MATDPPARLTEPFPVLLFTKTAPGSYRHTSIPAAIAGLQRLAARSGRFIIEATEADSAITPESLARFPTIIFLHNIDDFLSGDQVAALRGYVRSGRGGFVGVHSAAAGLFDDPWYGSLVGAHFDFHPEAQWGVINIEEPRDYIAAGRSEADDGVQAGAVNEDSIDGVIGAEMKNGNKKKWFDEWYNFKTNPRKMNTGLKILMAAEEGTYTGGTGDDHPLAWRHEFEGARVFYTALGHFDEAYEDEWFLGQLERAILWTSRAESL